MEAIGDVISVLDLSGVQQENEFYETGH